MDFDRTPSWTMLDCWLRDAQEESESSVATAIKRRDNPRLAWNLSVEVLNTSQDGKLIPCRIRDINEKGLGLICRERLNTWDRIRIQRVDRPDEYVDGVVVHCTQTIGGFKVGVNIE